MTKTENAPAVLSPAIDYEDDKILQTIVATVAKGATRAELQLFVERCKSTGLNPFKREIWFIKVPIKKNGVPTGDFELQIMTGLWGFYAIANSHPQFDGIDEPEFGKDNYGEWVRCSAWRKDRSRPHTVKLYRREFAKRYGNWQSMPQYMLGKCAEAHALKRAFPQELNGLRIPEEMPEEFGETTDAVVVEAVSEREQQEQREREARQAEEMRLAQRQAETQKAIDDASPHYLYKLPSNLPKEDKQRIATFIRQNGGIIDKQRGEAYTLEPVAELERFMAVDAEPVEAPEQQEIPA